MSDLTHPRTYWVKQVVEHGVHPRVAYSNLKAVQPNAYQNAAHGTSDKLTEKTFTRWIDEYSEFYVHKTHNKTYQPGERIGKP
jgi:hypothetical protein